MRVSKVVIPLARLARSTYFNIFQTVLCVLVYVGRDI